ncbi:MAG: glycosyltransferase [Paracoccaceae bacterium]
MVPGVTMTVTRLGEPDDMLRDCLAALAAQEGAQGEILLIEQKLDSDLRGADFSNTRWRCRIIRARLPGLSAARNLALEEAGFDQVLFCDADAVPHAGWAAAMQDALAQPGVAIVGSRILPRWTRRQPLLARAQVVRDQLSLYDLGEDSRDVPRVVGAGFGLDRAHHPEEMRFDEALGRRDGRLFGGEESDLCQRVAAAGGRIVYVGGAVVDHVIQPERHRARWILTRLYYAGLGRSQAGGAPSPSRKPGLWDWLLLPVILPPYALGWVRGRRGRQGGGGQK